jgi:carboxylesterase type B
MKLSCALVCLPALAIAAAVTKTVVVPAAVLEPGIVYGVATSVPVSDTTVYKFVGIPYAVTPPKRFLPPEKLEHFQGGSVNATTLPLPCFQAHNSQSRAPYAGQNALGCVEPLAKLPTDAETAEEMALESEDCLYINVYTPAGGDCKSVMFWIYGGDLQNGDSANALFDGTTLAATQDVVVVTFNYRVNGSLFKVFQTGSLSKYFVLMLRCSIRLSERTHATPDFPECRLSRSALRASMGPR